MTVKTLPITLPELKQRLDAIGREHGMSASGLIDAVERGEVVESPALMYAVVADAALRSHRATRRPHGSERA